MAADRPPGAGLRRGRAISFILTTALVVGALAIAFAPLWVPVTVAVLFVLLLSHVFLRERRRGGF